MQEIEQKLRDIFQEALPPHLFLIEAVVKGTGRLRLEVTLDGDRGVTVNECAEMSRKVGKVLEELDFIDVPYELFVASPGVDKPLRLPRQFPKNIGRTLSVTLKNGGTCSGKLTETTETGLTLEEQTTEREGKKKKKVTLTHSLKFEEIEGALVEISFK